jgi:Carboxypeptidase regulatory-like domain
MNFGRARSILLLWSTAVFAYPQGPTVPPTTATQNWRISGTVVYLATGQPLGGIEVTISSTEQRDVSVQTVSGPDGHFAFDDLARGKYSLAAHGRGFATQAYQQHGPYSTAVAVGPGLQSENLIFQLVPDASISGIVLDDQNEPVRSGDVLLFSRGAGSDIGKVQLHERGSLDDQGRYHFGHLPPGTYLVAVAAQPWYAQDPPGTPKPTEVSTDRQSPANQEASAESQETRAPFPLDVAYQTTFYTDTTEPENATPILLHAGERATADVTLRAVPALHLTVRGVGSDPAQPGTVFAQQRLFDGVPIALPARSQQFTSGVVRVSGITPGHFILVLRKLTGKEWTSESREVDVSADTEIDASENVLGIVTLQGAVQLPGGAPVPPGTNIRFLNRGTGEAVVAQVSPKGTFEAQQALVAGAECEVSVFSLPDFAVQDLTATGAKVVGRTLLLSRSGAVRLAVTMSKGFARVDGTVLREDKPEAAAMVLLVPQHIEGNLDLFRRDQSDSDGTFTLYRAVPGRYIVVAIENGWDLDWQSPAVLKPYLERGQPIEVTANGTYKVSITAQDSTTPASKPAQP